MREAGRPAFERPRTHVWHWIFGPWRPIRPGSTSPFDHLLILPHRVRAAFLAIARRRAALRRFARVRPPRFAIEARNRLTDFGILMPLF